jgi:hypothetical protein
MGTAKPPQNAAVSRTPAEVSITMKTRDREQWRNGLTTVDRMPTLRLKIRCNDDLP